MGHLIQEADHLDDESSRKQELSGSIPLKKRPVRNQVHNKS